MLFWTIVFLTWYLIILIKGNIFYDATIKSGELEILKAESKELGKINNTIKDIAKEQLELIWPIYLLIPFFICEYIFLINLINIDIYKYPTIIILAYSILSLILNNREKKVDLNTEEGRKEYKIKLYQIKKRTLKSFIYSSCKVIFYGYIFYLLVFIL